MAKIYEIAFQIAGKLGSNFASTFLSAQKTIQNMDGQIKKLTSNQAKITRFESLKRELVSTEQQFQAAQAKVKALADEMKAAEQPTKSLEKAFNKAKNEAGQLKEKVSEQQDNLSKMRGEMQQAGISTTNLAQHQRKLSSELDTLKSKKDAFSSLQTHIDQFKASTVSAFKSVSMGAAAATAAISSYAGVAISLANKANDAATRARSGAKMGFGVEQFQEISYAAKMSGVAVEDFDGCMKKMVVNLAKAKSSGEVAKEFNGLGISVQELNSMAPDQALMKIADAMSQIQDPAERTRLTVALFGKEGMNMVPMLKQGSAGLQNFRDEARKMGLVLDEQTVKQAAAYGKVKKQFANVMEGAKLTIGSALLPVLTTGAQELMDLLKANQGDIKAFSTKFADGLRTAIPYAIQTIKLVKDIASWGITMGKGVLFAVGGFDHLKWVIAAIIAYKMAFVFYSTTKNMIAMGQDAIKLAGIIRQVGFAALFLDARMRAVAIATRMWTMAQTALNAVMHLNPIMLCVVAALALGAAAYYVITHWEQVKAWMAPFVAVIQAGWGIVKAVMAGDWDGVLAAINNFIESVKNLFMPLFNWISEKWNSIKSAFRSGPDMSGSPGVDMPGHAAGGIFNREHIARFAEGGKTEAAIPMTDPVRGPSIWAQAGQMMGLIRKPDKATGVNGGASFVYSPTNYFGNMTPQQVGPALEKDRQDFERQVEDYEARKRRLSFA